MPIIAPLALFTSVESDDGQLRNYVEQVKIISSSNICSVVDKFIEFISNDVDVKPSRYTASRPKVVTPEENPSNKKIFYSYFDDEIKDLYTEKVYEKSCLVIQTHNDEDENLVVT